MERNTKPDFARCISVKRKSRGYVTKKKKTRIQIDPNPLYPSGGSVCMCVEAHFTTVRGHLQGNGRRFYLVSRLSLSFASSVGPEMDENHYLRSTFYTNEHITIIIVVVVVTQIVRKEETTIKPNPEAGQEEAPALAEGAMENVANEKKKRRARRCAISSLDLYLYVSAFIKFI